jgi:hypothetical protein
LLSSHASSGRSIRPNDQIIEFGAAALKYVQRGDDVYFEASDLRTRPAQGCRLTLIAREYGVQDREAVCRALCQAK